MATQKTLPAQLTVLSFIENITDESVKQDTLQLIQLMEEVTGETAVMWGTAIIGFGSYRYRYASGHEGTSCKVGFSPRKDKFALYIACDANGEQATLLSKLGKHKTGKGCLYIKKLSDVDIAVLKQLVAAGFTRQIAYML